MGIWPGGKVREIKLHMDIVMYYMTVHMSTVHVNTGRYTNTERSVCVERNGSNQFIPVLNRVIESLVYKFVV
jgi:hypothetical protein